MTTTSTLPETQLKSQEKKYFDAYYRQTSLERQLINGGLVKYFQDEFDRAERLYGKSLNHAANVLDLGSGWGTLSIWAAERYPQWRVVSTDYVEYSLSIHDEMADLMHITRRNERSLADWDSLPFADHSFDYVLADRALHHALDPVHMMREVRRVTKPGGILIVLREPTLPVRRPEAREMFAVEMLEEGTNDHIWTAPEWASILREAGWETSFRVHVEDIRKFLQGGTSPLSRRIRKWLAHRVSHDWIERALYPFVVQWGSTPQYSKLTFYAQASKSSQQG